ncbi:hypothetical protein GCM10010985_38030 [Caballeronia grimmiae]|uniref:Uncharacterized protein n=1 Tax=Caballeronia grimmiae TaxID=1071679 RepID=A0ABQ1RSG4_9BURK|nr:hypothetical protein GCM10010985_38030 [Caballeronia grimmiae]
MQRSQQFSLLSRHHALQLRRMRDPIDGGVNESAIAFGLRGQRRVFLNRRFTMPKQHRLKDCIAGVRMHRTGDHARERIEEALSQRRIRHRAACRRDANLFDDERQRRLGTECMGIE